jgi:hypothetical protein
MKVLREVEAPTAHKHNFNSQIVWAETSRFFGLFKRTEQVVKEVCNCGKAKYKYWHNEPSGMGN